MYRDHILWATCIWKPYEYTEILLQIVTLMTIDLVFWAQMLYSYHWEKFYDLGSWNHRLEVTSWQL